VSLAIRAITFDAGDPQTLSRFWSELLSWEAVMVRGEVCVRPSDGSDTPVLLFLPVPEGKTAKNRTHPDLHTDDVDTEVARAVELGATVTAWHQQDSRWAVLQDPEGNEFCIIQPPE